MQCHISKLKTKTEIQLEERSKIGRQLHDLVANQLLHLQFLVLKSEKEINKESFARITEEIELIRNQVRHFSHQISIPEPNFKDGFIESVKDLLLDYAYLFPDIVFEFNLFPKKIVLDLPYTKHQELIVVLKELIQNALQHGQPKMIELSITDFDDEFNIMLEDDGKGFNLDHKVEGIGLLNCKNRIENNEGTLIIDSLLNRGTAINITVKK